MSTGQNGTVSPNAGDEPQNPTKTGSDHQWLNVLVSFTIYPHVAITTYAYPDEDRVALMLGNETVEIHFQEVNDLQRFRNAIDELIPLLTEQINHLNTHTHASTVTSSTTD